VLVEREAHAATLANAPGICRVCHDEAVDAPGMICYCCVLINQGRHPRVASTPIEEVTR